jgi:hypothetical protein
MEIQFDGNWVLIPMPKALLVLSRQAFIDGLRQGKRYRRRKALAARLAPDGKAAERSTR